MPCQCRTLLCSSLFGVFFRPLPGTEQKTSDRIIPCSIRPHQCQSFTSLYIFLVKFYAIAPHRLHHWHPLSKEVITSTVNLKVGLVPTGAVVALPVPTACLLLWASWACSLGRYEVLSSRRKLVCLFPRTSDLGSSWAAARACFLVRLRKKMCSVHLFSVKVRHV